MKDRSEKEFFCPVCKKVISGRYLPSIESVIEDELCYSTNLKIVNSTVTIVCNFDHFFDEEKDMMLKEQHSLTAIIKAEFDSFGKCLSFGIIEISSGGVTQ